MSEHETSSAGVVSPPGGTETYLFTDVEGSTRLLQRLGERFGEVLLAQRRLLLESVEAFGGREVGTAGDGTFAVFRRARDAVAAAAAAQRAFAAHAWPAGATLRVRMGVHTGEAALAGNIHTGLDVIRAARIANAAHGGQVLLSQTTHDLVERDLPAGVGVRALGEHQLKDLPRPERLWQLIIEGIASEFPPLRTPGPRPHNLPLQATPLLGREQELEDLHERLLRDDVHLLTLTGPGGTGKTRLALQVAARLIDRFADGVYLVALGSASDAALLPSRIAQSLRLSENPTRSLTETLQEHLQSRQVLLLLDNFEQLLAGAPLLSELLAASPRLKVLVTSRIVLRLRGEHEYPVSPLPVPDTRAAVTPESLAGYAAVALFVQRAQAVKPDFVLGPDNAAAVARICAWLDGLPLAIELAAARIKLFSPQAMLARLSSRLDLLKGGSRDLPPRQQTLRQAIAWSYDLLDADQRAYFRRLAVFRGGCTLDAAERVCNAAGDLALDALDALATLIDHSLLRRLDTPADEPRFVVLETLQEYGRECLRAEGEEPALQRAHAEYFLALAEQAEPELTGARQGLWLDRLESEHDNLRAALEWAGEEHEGELGLRLGAALWRFWASRGHLREGRARLEHLLRQADPRARTAARARALHGAGTLIYEIADHDAARPLLEESLEIWRELDHRPGMARVLNALGWMAAVLGELDTARSRSAEALALHRELGDRRGTAVALHNLAWAAVWGSEYEAARALEQEALALRQEAGDRRGAAYMLVSLAWIDQLQGDYATASARVAEGLEALRALRDRQITAWALEVQGRIAYDQGQLETALATLEESRALWAEVGNQDSHAWCLADLAGLLCDLGQVARAADCIAEAKQVARASFTRFGIARAVISLAAAQVKHRQGEREAAVALYRESLALQRRLGDRRAQAVCLEGLAELHLEADAERATRLLALATALRDAAGTPLPPRSQPAHEQALATLRERLGDRFTPLWDAGRGMALEEVEA